MSLPSEIPLLDFVPYGLRLYLSYARKLLNLRKHGSDRRGWAGCESSKRVHEGEAVGLVPDLRYLTDSIMRT